MGTNYDAQVNHCESCERYDEIHIGKSSAGWRFQIEIHELYYKTSNELYEFLSKKDVDVYDEYGKLISVEELFKIIEDKKDLKSHFEDYPESKYADDEFADLQKGAWNMKTDYTKFTKEQLQEKIIELEMRITKSHGKVVIKEKPENRSRFRKEIARMKTELNKRK